jgi:hypothetical protein
MPVGVDEARHHDHVGRVDNLRVFHREAAPDLDDRAVLDEDVAVRDLADVGVHRDHEAVANEQSLRAHVPLLRWPVTNSTTVTTAVSEGERVSRRRMYSEHKHAVASASTALHVGFS